MPEYLEHLFDQLNSLPAETEWLERKVNNSDPDTIGQNISAISNGARLSGAPKGYIIWGVSDSGEAVGTEFEPQLQRIGNEPLPLWMFRLGTKI